MTDNLHNIAKHFSTSFEVIKPHLNIALASAADPEAERKRLIEEYAQRLEHPYIAAAKGYISAGFNVSGTNYPVIKDIQKYVVAKGKTNMEDK